MEDDSVDKYSNGAVILRNLVPRAFSSTIFKMADRRRSAILKIVEERALGTRL